MLDRNSNEYRKKFAGMIKQALHGDDYKQNRDSLVTVNTHGIMIPKILDEKIWDEMSTEHPILADVTKVSDPGLLEVTRHVTTTSETKATVHGEVYETPAEDNGYEIVTLKGQDIRTGIEISYASANMSEGALEKYLIENIKNQMSAKLAEYIFDNTIEYITDLGQNDAPNVTNAYWKSWTDEDTGEEHGRWNLEKRAITYNDVCKTIGKCEGGNNLKIYTSRYQKYRNLIGMTDTAGQPVIHPKKGTILGLPVVEENGLSEHRAEWIATEEDYSIYGAMVVCDPSKILLNVITPLTIEITPKPEKATILITAYMRVGVCLRDKRALSCWAFANKATDALPITKTRLNITTVVVDDDGNASEYLYSDSDTKVGYHLDGLKYYNENTEEYSDWFCNCVESVPFKPGEKVTVQYGFFNGYEITTSPEDFGIELADLTTAYLGEWQGEELTWEHGDTFPWSFTFTLPLDHEYYEIYVCFKSTQSSSSDGSDESEATIMTLSYDEDGNAIATPLTKTVKRENVGNRIVRIPKKSTAKTKKRVSMKVKKA